MQNSNFPAAQTEVWVGVLIIYVAWLTKVHSVWKSLKKFHFSTNSFLIELIIEP